MILKIARALLLGATACLPLVSTTLAQPGSVDFSFYAGSSVDFEIFQVGLQSNGKVIIGGAFGSPSRLLNQAKELLAPRLRHQHGNHVAVG